MCDTIDDILQEPVSKMRWKELVVGDRRDKPVHNLTQKHLARIQEFDLEKLTIINQLNFTERNFNVFPPKSIVFYGNNITTLWFLPFVIIRKMDSVSLQKNNFESIYHLFYDISSEHSVKKIDLSYNKLVEIYSGTFDYMVVEELNLANNQLSLIRKPAGLPLQLKRLNLDHNKFESLSSMSLAHHNLSSLEVFTVVGNNMNTLEDLPALESLEMLDVSFNKIYLVGNAVNRLTNLKILMLKGNNLVRFSFPDFLAENTPSPYIFLLSFNRLRNLELEAVEENVNVRLILAGNPWNCQCIDKMEKILTKTKAIRRGKCDERFAASGVIPVCAIDYYKGERCSEDQINQQQFDLFRSVSVKAAWNDSCDFQDVYSDENFASYFRPSE